MADSTMFHVKQSRPPTRVAAQVVRADRLPLLERYAELLATDGVVRGLIGPREVPRLWDRHILNCALAGPLVPAGLPRWPTSAPAPGSRAGAGDRAS